MLQDRVKKRESAVRRCKALVEALMAVILGLDDGTSAIPEGTPRYLHGCSGIGDDSGSWLHS